MKNIIRYLAGIEIISYLFFGGHIAFYMIIAYMNDIDSIRINAILQMLISSLIMGMISSFIYELDNIKDSVKLIINYILLLIVFMIFSINFNWLNDLSMSIAGGVLIYTFCYLSMIVISSIYLRTMGESYTDHLTIYKERKRRD